jgi:N4-gp56 family major capsid protein
MALTNFAALTDEQKTAWSMDLWKNARNQSFVSQFLGKGPNSLIQHVTEVKKSEKGARAVMTLLADLEGDGVAGDRTLEGNEEAMKTYEQVIRVDQLRHANRSKGRISDQKSIVEFRSNSRDVLAYWLADRIDQLAFLTLAGRSYAYTPKGVARVGSDLQNLEFAADVTTSSALRRARWDASTGLETTAAIGDVDAGDTPTWNTLMELKKYAKEQYIRGVKNGSQEIYHAFLCPQAMMLLKQSDDYKANLRYAQTRGGGNELFTGDSVLIDGVMLHEFRHVPQWTSTTNDFGDSSDVAEGSHILFCGAQALGMADLGAPEWNEKEFDYGNQLGISTGKILGFLKPQYVNQYSGSTTAQDFGVINCFVAHA